MTKISRLLLLAVLVATSPALVAQGVDVASPEQPDPRVQSQIHRVVEAIIDANKGGPPEAVLELVDGLEMLVENDRERLLAQVAWFLSRAEGTEQTMGGAVLIDNLAFTDAEKVGAVAPRLETENAEFRKVLEDLLSTVDRPNGGQPDFAPYRRYLGALQGDPPQGLIRYMYEVSANEAFLSLLLVYLEDGPERRSLALTQQALSTTGPEGTSAVEEQFAALAEHEIWWVRLFAVEVLVDRPEFGTSDTLVRLREDPHPLVRNAAGG
jgi:hypothetical protein